MQCAAIGKVYPAIQAGSLHDLPGKILRVPSLVGSSDPDLVMKLSETGITWLHERRFKKRYTGSTTCAIDINGTLFASAGDLDKELKRSREKDAPKKKSVGMRPHTLKFISENSPPGLLELGAISQETSTLQNLSSESGENETKVAKKERKKSYKIDKPKVRSRILAYLNTQKGKKHLYFWTVSFPEHTPDDVCYQAFNTWLTALRQQGMLREYLWIAERQMGDRLKVKKAPTHTIHFHIAIPHFMNAPRANAMMRGTLKGLAKKGLLPGVVCNAKSKEQYFLPSIAKYNGVDIAKHRNTGRVINFAIKKGARALGNYLTKYVTKNDAGQLNESGELIAPGFTHLAWHCSRGFSRLFTGITCTISEFKAAGYGGYLNRTRVFKMEFATFIPWLFGPPHALMEHLYKLNSEIQKLFDNEQQATNTG